MNEDQNPALIEGSRTTPALLRWYRLPEHVSAPGTKRAKRVEEEKARKESAPKIIQAVNGDKDLVTRKLLQYEQLQAIWQAGKHVEKKDASVRMIRWEYDFVMEIVGYSLEAHGHAAVDVSYDGYEDD